LPTVVLSLFGQALLKKGLKDVLQGRHPTAAAFFREHLFAVLFSPAVILGAVLCCLGAVAWLFVLSRYELSRALPLLAGLVFLALFFVDKLVLGEQTSWTNFAGILVLILGIFLISAKAPA
jgi:drug/metabolite transporter (DMT)-like permease